MPTTTATASQFGALREELQTALLASFPELVARIGWDRRQIAAHQRQRLRALLGHAVERSPFHARRLRGIDLAAVDPGDLSLLPVMTKSEMMNELDDVFTDRRLTHHSVERALAEAGPEPAPGSPRPAGDESALICGAADMGLRLIGLDIDGGIGQRLHGVAEQAGRNRGRCPARSPARRSRGGPRPRGRSSST